MKKAKRRVLVTGKLYREGFYNSLRVKDWSIVVDDDEDRIWSRWTPLIGRKIKIVAEVL